MSAGSRCASELLRLLALVLALGWAPIGTSAQESAGAAPPPVVSRDMVATLSDEQVRKLLLEQLEHTPPTEAAGAPHRPWVLTSSHKALERLQRLVASWGGSGEEARRLAVVVAANHTHPWLGVLAAIAACLGAGALLERFMLRRGGILGGLQQIGRRAAGGKLSPGQVLLAALARSAGALVFLAGSVLAVHLVPGLSEGARVLASATVWGVGGTRLVWAGMHAVLLPHGGESPWPVSQPVAHAVARYLSVVSGLVLLRLMDRHVLAYLGANADFITTVTLVTSAALIVAVLIAIFAVRAAMGPARSGSGVSGLLRDRWHYLAAGYVLLVFVLGVYAALIIGQPVLMRALASLSVVLVIPVIDYGLRLLAARLAPTPPAAEAQAPLPADDPAATYGEASAALHHEQLSLPAAAPPDEQAPPAAGQPALIEDALVLNFRVLLALVTVQAICSLWGIQVFDLVGALFGDQLAGALSEIAIAGLFVFIVWQIVKAAVRAYAVPEPEPGVVDLSGEGGTVGRTRIQTLAPLIAKTVGATLIAVLALITLSALGVNISPLLAGAGVVGLAVGFGAQTLVRDIVSGVFFLADDAFRMGEYLAIGNIRGTVEKISVRSLRLRHHRGPLPTLPYGEIRSMTNYSRDYVIMKFEVRVPFETDVEKVRKLIKQVGAELAQNEEYASVMLEPLKSQGVNRMDDSAFVIRCKFTTLARQAVRRAQGGVREDPGGIRQRGDPVRAQAGGGGDGGARWLAGSPRRRSGGGRRIGGRRDALSFKDQRTPTRFIGLPGLSPTAPLCRSRPRLGRHLRKRIAAIEREIPCARRQGRLTRRARPSSHRGHTVARSP